MRCDEKSDFKGLIRMYRNVNAYSLNTKMVLHESSCSFEFIDLEKYIRTSIVEHLSLFFNEFNKSNKMQSLYQMTLNYFKIAF